MVWNVIRLILLIWIVRVIYKWYSAYRENEKRKAYEAGVRDAHRRKNGGNDNNSGDYIDYEEIK